MLPAPTSPCINLCVLDDSAHCKGCHRHVDEIARWSSMSTQEQWAVIIMLEERRRDRESRRC